MNRTIPLTTRPEVPITRPPVAGRVCFVLFLGAFFLVWLKIMLPARVLENTGWPEGALVLAATASTIAALCRELPLQNVMMAAVVAGLVGGFARAIGTLTALPFGPSVYHDAAGPRLFGVLPWFVPFVWITIILTSRGVGRLLLKPWRTSGSYGFWLMGGTALLSVVLELGVEPFATRTRHYWSWQKTSGAMDWGGVPMMNLAGGFAAAMMIVVFITPLLINKKPGPAAPGYHPLVVFILLNLLFATAAIQQHLWVAAGVSGVAAGLVVMLAARAARQGRGVRAPSD